jgi:hypothetical protein
VPTALNQLNIQQEPPPPQKQEQTPQPQPTQLLQQQQQQQEPLPQQKREPQLKQEQPLQPAPPVKKAPEPLSEPAKADQPVIESVAAAVSPSDGGGEDAWSLYADAAAPGSVVGRKRWYEGCSYVCLACRRSYDIYFSYHGHIKKIHDLSMEQYHARYGNLTVIKLHFFVLIS